jgi:hypothetical protein
VKLLLRREAKQPDADCTLGFLFVIDDKGAPLLSLVTMERPWIRDKDAGDLGGEKNRSCVPCGTYKLVRHDSPNHPKTWALVNHDLDVVHFEGDDGDPDEDRATCLLHSANYVNQVEGCIAPGTRTAKASPGHGSTYMVCDSQKAMSLLRSLVPWTDDHTLEISET